MAFKSEQYEVVKVTLELSYEEFEMLKTGFKYFCYNNHEGIPEEEMWKYDNLLDIMTS
jgi:hypothetical protein